MTDEDFIDAYVQCLAYRRSYYSPRPFEQCDLSLRPPNPAELRIIKDRNAQLYDPYMEIDRGLSAAAGVVPLTPTSEISIRRPSGRARAITYEEIPSLFRRYKGK